MKQLTGKLEPLLSGRTLIRALNSLKQHKNMNKFEIFSVFFLTQFDLQSRAVVYSLLSKIYTCTKKKISKTYIEDNYILTPKTQLQLTDIMNGIILNCPILLQGDTSTGKTSIIMHLAKKNNIKVIRINNHEHIEPSDYLGNYVTTNNGIEFKESLFIKAIKNGWWVILDELNLAQSDVLEVLNRLLDFNREIYLPQTDETIKAHEDFRFFATQNLEYGGRKRLSKAFRNRFIEIFFLEKDDNEVLEILHLRTKLPKSFCVKMINVYVMLKNQRNVDNLITLRDLFRWAKRKPSTLYEVYETGMSVIYERLRNDYDREKVRNVFDAVFGSFEQIYCECTENSSFIINNKTLKNIENQIIITKSIMKLIRLLNAAIKHKEPILLIGETGIGKTKIFEVLAYSLDLKFNFINMHNGSESADFIGSFYLNKDKILWKDGILVNSMKNGDCILFDEINLAEDAVLERLNSLLEDNRDIFITDIDKTIVAHDNFILCAYESGK